jgi:hypothetical protein
MVIKSRLIRWADHVALMGNFRNSYNILVRQTEGMTQFGRTRFTWKDNIKMILKEIGREDVDLIFI